MNPIKAFKRWLLTTAMRWCAPTVSPLPPAEHELIKRRRIRVDALRQAAIAPHGSTERGQAYMRAFPLPEPPRGFKEAGGVVMDDQIQSLYSYANFGAYGAVGAWGDGGFFLGFPYLSELTQRAEYRNAIGIRAEEMVRKGFELTYTDDEDDEAGADILADLEQDCETYGLEALLHKFAELDGQFGRAHIYVDTGDGDRPDELKTPLALTPQKVAKGSLKGFRTVEPIWTYPNAYNSSDPLAPNFFRPETWFVQGKLVHHTRLLTGVSTSMPDLLKPAYAFAGLSLAQQLKPYVDNWLRTRQSVSDLVHSFSVPVLKTNMQSTIEDGDNEGLFGRLDLFNLNRDNRGVFALDMESEDFVVTSVPLGGLHELQAQAQEQMASIARVPLVKLLGITPSGLNASSDGEIRVFYDSIASWQKALFGVPIKTMLDVMQLSRYGRIDPKVGFKFIPLWQLDEAGKAAVEKSEADTDAVLIESGVVHPEESRRRLANKAESAYSGLDVADVPEPPDDGQEPDDGANPAQSVSETKSVERAGV